MAFVIKRKSLDLEIEHEGGIFVFRRPNEHHRLSHLQSLPTIILKFSNLTDKEKVKFFKDNEETLNAWNVSQLSVKIARAFELFITAKNIVDDSGAEVTLSKEELWQQLDFETKQALATKLHSYVTGTVEEDAGK